MPKYLIEGAIDFYSELYKSLDDDENQFKTEEDDNLCLITKQPLTTNYVTMLCGHKFNYMPLFKDINNHKKNFNNMEGTSGRLGKNEIRCPYCRKKQTQLLPYYDDMGVPKVSGVNELFISTCNETKSLHHSYGVCEFMIPIHEVDSDDDNIDNIVDSSGVCFKKCNSFGTPICVNTNDTNYNDTKKYCWTHKKFMIRKYKKEMVNKIKEETKIAKQKLKDETKQLKANAKLKEKEDKKLKQKKPICENENVIVGPLHIITEKIENIENKNETNHGCVTLLKTGANKGSPCGCMIYNMETKLCKRHYTIQNKSNITNV